MARMEGCSVKEKQYERVRDIDYESFVRRRITELRIHTNPYISERKMSLELGRGDTYIRNIVDGSLPSMSAFFDILDYLDVSIDEFFAPLKDMNSPYNQTCERLRACGEEDLAKVNTFLDMIGK